MNKKLLFALATVALVPTFMFAGCGHEHSFKDVLKSNETHHWQECSCGKEKNKAEHSEASTYSTNETHHWKDCTDCGYDLGLEIHAFTQEVQNQLYFSTETDTKTVYFKSCECGAKGSDTFDVNKTVGQIESFVVTDKNYDGSPITVTATTNSNGAMTFEYKEKNADDSTYTTTAPVDVGEYTVRVSVAGTGLYSSVSETKDFTISPFEISGLNKDFVYNGSAVQTVELPNTIVPQSEISLEITFDSKDVNSGIASVRVLLNGSETQNYTVQGCTASIVKKEVGLNWSAPQNLAFDGTEKEPTVIATGLCGTDACEVSIIKETGDNVMYGSSFTYVAVGLSNDNYKLPQNVVSPSYTVTDLVEMQIGEGEDFYAELEECEYAKIQLEAEKYYYFTFDAINQGSEFVFALYKKDGNILIGTRAVSWADAVTCEMDEEVFYIEEAGEYYIEAKGSVDGYNEGTLKVMLDNHSDIDNYGHCNRCGAYQGVTESINTITTINFESANPIIYRFKVDYNLKQRVEFESGEFNYTAYGVSYAGSDYDADTEKYNVVREITDFDSMEACDYIYLVITQKGVTTSVTFQLEEAEFFA